MKFLRYFIIVLLLLMGLFFLIGIFNKELNYTEETTVNRPINTVWEKFNDPDITMEYIPEIEKMTLIKEMPGMVGSKSKIKMGGSRPMDIMETVLAYEEGKYISLQFDAGGMKKVDSYTFTPINNKTKITSTHNIKGDGIMTRAMYFLLKGVLAKTDKDHQARFKKIVETRF